MNINTCVAGCRSYFETTLFGVWSIDEECWTGENQSLDHVASPWQHLALYVGSDTPYRVVLAPPAAKQWKTSPYRICLLQFFLICFHF